MSTINDNDQFLVQRGTTSFKQSAKDLMSTIQDTDLMLIQRGTESYKVTCLDVKEQLGGPGAVSISKGTITPDTGVEAGMLLTGSATVSGNVEPTVYYHRWYVDGVQDVNATSNTFTAVEGQITYKLCITDPNNTDEVCGELSDPVTAAPATQPFATMHGLRFHAARLTKLQREGGSIASHTLSCWVKVTGTPHAGDLFINNGGVLPDVRGYYVDIDDQTAGQSEVKYWNGSSGTVVVPTLTHNTWHHLVFVQDGTTITTYLDGVSQTQVTVTEGIGSVALIAANLPENENAVLNGYMSEVYCVEQVLNAETFGQLFNGKWGPLDSSVIKEKINGGGFGVSGFYLPFNSAATGVNYSNTLTTFSEGASISRHPAVFDGLTTTGASVWASTGNYIEWTTPGGIDASTSLRVWWGGDTNASSEYKWVINGVDQATFTGGNPVANPGWQTLPSTANLTTLRLEFVAGTFPTGPNGMTWSAVEINGKLIVDHKGIGVDDSGNNNHFYDYNLAVAGNTDKVWSDNLQDVMVTALGGCFTGALDRGVVAVDGIESSPNVNVMKWNVPIEFQSKQITVGITDAGTPDGSRVFLSTNLVSQTTLGSYRSSIRPYYLESTSIGECIFAAGTTIINVSSDAGGSRTGFVYFIVDGQVLVDKNIIDSVLDTPLNNYAVLETGDNGNLLAEADAINLTYTGEAGTNYYYEADGVGAVHTGGSAFSSTDAVTYNFGQQPFSGTPTEAGRLFQTWTQWTTLLLTARVADDEARISQLEQVIIDQSVPFEMNTVYQKGAIVDFGGNLLEALVDGADITRSDVFSKRFGTVVDQVEWADLEIKTGQAPDWPEFERPERPTTLPAPIPESEDETDFAPTGTSTNTSTMSVEERTERRRAHNADGTFRADDPSTPDINEAWEDGEA